MKIKLLKRIRKELNRSYRLVYYPYECIYKVERFLGRTRYEDIWDSCKTFLDREDAIKYYKLKLENLKNELLDEYLSTKYKPIQIYP